MQQHDAIVVGAGPAGLACAASLRAVGLDPVVLEQADGVASVWRRHYDRLHLHTDRDHSGLPGMPMPRSYPKYPSRAEVVDYFDAYARRFEIRPRFNTRVERLVRDGANWRAECAETVAAPIAIVATGIASAPHSPNWPGLDSYAGDIAHSSLYRNPAPYAGKRTLVVGFGNSGGEIALDLAEAGVDVSLAVRGPVQIVPRDLLGLPIISWAIFYQRLPARLVDLINAPVLRIANGRVGKLGLRLHAKGPRQRIDEDGRTPIIDVGTLEGIRSGAIRLRGGIGHFTDNGVVFTDGRAEPFEAVILATGFRPDLRPLLPGATDVLDRHGAPLCTGATTGEPGLYFCGQIVVATGQLREIAIEAERIARLAKAHVEALSRSAA